MAKQPKTDHDVTDVSGQPKVRAINVEVPEETYWHVRKCAIDSHLSMKEYMGKFCQEAWPYPTDEKTETGAPT
jgi:hypothetical protein